MIADCLLDTNVLFYAAMGRFAEPEKYRRAREVIAGTHFALSSQVVQEFIVNVTKKSDKPLTFAEAIEWIDALVDRPFFAMDLDAIRDAAALAGRYQISYWDACLIAAAKRLGSPVLYTEDLNHGQAYGPVRVVNPFREAA
jgi:predicted nucleic acid-binding protein